MITKDKLQFLQEIAQNNNREWFAENKVRYDAIKTSNKAFFESVYHALQETDELSELRIFRIYKDVRFSKDKSPYKTNFSCSISRKKGLFGGYYINIQPNNSFVGGGIWMPSQEELFRVRKEFEMDDQPIRNIIAEPKFKAFFGEIKAQDSLKTAPKGFDKDHPAIDLIKMKHWLTMRHFTDKEVTNAHFANDILETFLAMRPWFDYMTEVMSTDLNGVPIFE